jgi:hypothetical protein
MDKDKIIITEKDGAIILRSEEVPEIYAPLGVGEGYDNIRFTLAFFLYAVDREDWISEFGEFVDQLREREVHEPSAEARRSKFKIIEGDKDE